MDSNFFKNIYLFGLGLLIFLVCLFFDFTLRTVQSNYQKIRISQEFYFIQNQQKTNLPS